MKTIISEQQAAFFTKNGFIEFEQNLEKILPLIQASGRDLWRALPPLQQFLVRTLGSLALALTGKTSLRLGCDHHFLKEDLPKKQGNVKELLSLQGMAICLAIAKDPMLPKRPSPLGILPSPSKANHILFFKPNLILDWPSVTNDVYLAIYTLPNAVYIHNPNDPHTNHLKARGYHFGDLLKNECNPVIL
jgi:hypothetical protein